MTEASSNIKLLIDVLKDYHPRTDEEKINLLKSKISDIKDMKEMKKIISSSLSDYDYDEILRSILEKLGLVVKCSDIKGLLKVLNA